MVGTTGRYCDRLGDISAAFGLGEPAAHGHHIDPATNGIETLDREWTRLSEIEYLASAARWWIPELAERYVALRFAHMDVCAVR